MVEVTQADRDAASEVGAITEERYEIVSEAFARHRIAERKAIVDWLRTCFRDGNSMADAIERNQHMENTTTGERDNANA